MQWCCRRELRSEQESKARPAGPIASMESLEKAESLDSSDGGADGHSHALTLHEALEQRDFCAVEELLMSADCDLMEKDESDKIPLLKAIAATDYLIDPPTGSHPFDEMELLMILELFAERSEDRHWLAQDRQGCNALHLACDGWSPAALELVLEHAPPECMTAHDRCGDTPAMRLVNHRWGGVFPSRVREERHWEKFDTLPWEALIAECTLDGSQQGGNALLKAVLLYGDLVLSGLLDFAPPECDFTFEFMKSHSKCHTILQHYIASNHSSAEGLRLLLDRVLSSIHGSLLHYVDYITPDILTVLLERLTPKECAIRDERGFTALFRMIRDDRDIEKVLMIAAKMDHEDLGIRNNVGGTALTWVKQSLDGGMERRSEVLCYIARRMPEEALIESDRSRNGTSLIIDEVRLLLIAPKDLSFLEALLECSPRSEKLAVDNEGNNALHACFGINCGFVQQGDCWVLRTFLEYFREMTVLLELLLAHYPIEYGTMPNESGVTPAALAARVDERLGRSHFSNYFTHYPKNALS